MGSSGPSPRKAQPSLSGSKNSEARWTLTCTYSRCVTVHRIPDLSKPQFSHLENGNFKKQVGRWTSHTAHHTGRTRSVGVLLAVAGAVVNT